MLFSLPHFISCLNLVWLTPPPTPPRKPLSARATWGLGSAFSCSQRLQGWTRVVPRMGTVFGTTNLHGFKLEHFFINWRDTFIYFDVRGLQCLGVGMMTRTGP